MNLASFFGLRSPGLDLESPAVAHNPYPHYARLLEKGAIHYLPRHRFWLALSYDGVRTAFDDPRTFSNAPYAEIDAVLLAADPPRQTAIRKLLARRFPAESIDRLSGLARAEAERLVAPGTELDLVGGYGIPISQAVGAALVGFDAETVAAINRAAVATARDPDPLGAFIRGIDRLADAATLYRTLRAESEGELGDAELRSLVRLTWLAATVTTERVIANACLRLLGDATLRDRVRAAPELVPALVEEVLRLHPPEHMVPRQLTRPVEFEGLTLRRGAIVMLCSAAANRDPTHYDDPDALRPERASRDHFAFGRGVHLCLGAPLARRVIVAALETLWLDERGLEPAEPLDRLDWLASISALSPRRLRVRRSPA